MNRFTLSLLVLNFMIASHAISDEQRFIVLGTNAENIRAQASSRGMDVVRKMRHHPAVVIRGNANSARALASAVGGRFEEDVVYSIDGKGGGSTLPPKPEDYDWGGKRIGANLVLASGAGVKVCVSDTGIDLDHPDLAANIVGDFSFVSGTSTGDDDNGHGSHVAGTIAAPINGIGVIGVAPQASLIAAKGLNRKGSGFSSDLADTISECVLRGAQVINMSWGSSSPSAVIHSALIGASNAGVILVAAAGNNGGPVGYPAAFPEVIAVSALDAQDRLASFSSRGSEVEFSAPGVSIYSTYKRGTYTTLSGTSMATPHVSGVAALMLSVLPFSTRSDLRGISLGLPAAWQGSKGLIDAPSSAP